MKNRKFNFILVTMFILVTILSSGNALAAIREISEPVSKTNYYIGVRFYDTSKESLASVLAFSIVLALGYYAMKFVQKKRLTKLGEDAKKLSSAKEKIKELIEKKIVREKIYVSAILTELILMLIVTTRILPPTPISNTLFTIMTIIDLLSFIVLFVGYWIFRAKINKNKDLTEEDKKILIYYYSGYGIINIVMLLASIVGIFFVNELLSYLHILLSK